MSDEPVYKVKCYDSDRDVLSVIYTPHGNAMSHGEIVDRINDLQAENVALKHALDDRESNMELLRRAHDFIVGEWLHAADDPTQLDWEGIAYELNAAIECDHKFVDATNDVVKGGEICLKCGAIRATPNPTETT